MDYFKCTRCKRTLPTAAKPMSQIDFCVDCKDSDLKDAAPYFRDGHWKKMPKYILDLQHQELKER